MATTLEIINGISQVLANKHDGATNEDGEAITAGLRREDGDPLVDSRVIDGFGVKFYGNCLCLTYSSEIKLKEVYAGGFEDEIASKLSDVVSFIKKEYRGLTGNSLALESLGEEEILVQSISRVRSQVTASKHFRIGGLSSEPILGESEDQIRDATKKFLELGKKKPKSKNVKSSKDPFEVFKAYNFSNRKR